ncbi:MAG: hypothetical protein KGI97_01580 [Alphaproteobacteria bacterium]|nr:hypothetical protein [Alphaproteobacteria bacterium]
MFTAPLRRPKPDHPPAEVNFEDLLRQLDAHCAALPPAMFERFRFELDGIGVDVRRIKQSDGRNGDNFLITASIGSLPFSIESPERRQAIRDIVAAARTLPRVHCSIDMAGRITAGGLFEATRVMPPDFIFHPLALFLQEARPFMNLIGRYLRPMPPG